MVLLVAFPECLGLGRDVGGVAGRRRRPFCGGSTRLKHGCLLAAAVWLGYVADRWLDGRSIGAGRFPNAPARDSVAADFLGMGLRFVHVVRVAWASLGQLNCLRGAVLALACEQRGSSSGKHRFVPSRKFAPPFSSPAECFLFVHERSWRAVEDILPCFVAFLALCCRWHHRL